MARRALPMLLLATTGILTLALTLVAQADPAKAPKRAPKKPAAVASSAAAPAQTAPGSGLAVAGISLGMTLPQVKAALAKHTPKLRMNAELPVTVLNNVSFVSVVSGNSVESVPSGPRESIQVYFTPPPLPSQVFAISRMTRYDAASAISDQNIEASLREKYGPPTVGGRAWVWAPGGAPSSDTSLVATCGTIVGGALDNYVMQVPASPLGAPCARFLIAGYGGANGVSESLSISVADTDRLDTALKALEAKQQGAQQVEAQRQLKQANKNRPAL